MGRMSPLEDLGPHPSGNKQASCWTSPGVWLLLLCLSNGGFNAPLKRSNNSGTLDDWPQFILLIVGGELP